MAVTTVAAVGFSWYGFRHQLYDLTIYVGAMRWWDDGHPLYDFNRPDDIQGQLGFTYPPAAAVLMRPLAWMPMGAAMAIHVIGFVALLAWCVWLLTRPLALRRGWPVWLTFGVALILVTGLEPVRETLMLGQINAVLWALVLLDLLVLGRRGGRLAGVGIGFATALKLTPGIFIIYLLVARRWREAGVAAGTAAAVTLVAAAIAPRDSWTYWTVTLPGRRGVGDVAYEFNQSLLGLLARLNLDLPLLWVPLIVVIFTYGMWRAGRAAAAGDDLAGFTLTGIVGSLVSPVTWAHHIFWFAPALVVLLQAATSTTVVGSGLRGRPALATAAFCYATVTFSMISLWAYQLGRPGGVAGVLLTNWLVWLMLALLPLLPVPPPRQLGAAPGVTVRVSGSRTSS